MQIQRAKAGSGRALLACYLVSYLRVKGSHLFILAVIGFDDAPGGDQSVGSTPRVAAVAPNLFLVPTPRQVANANRHPPQLAHHLRKATASAGSSTALEDLQVVLSMHRCF